MKLHLLPILAALAWLGVPTTPPVAASSSLSPAAAVSDASTDASASSTPCSAWQTIYSGTFQNNWQYWGWGTANVSCPSPALSKDSIQATEGAYQAIYLHHAEIKTNPKMYLSFWVNGGATGGQSLTVKALRNGVPQTASVIPTLHANKWQRVIVGLSCLGVSSVPDLSGFWIQNNSATTLTPFNVDQIVLATSGVAQTPATPTGLKATPQWSASCPVCGGMAMPHIVVGWNSVSSATTYSVYRDGVKQVAEAAPGWTDMGVVSGKTYTYAVAASDAVGASPLTPPVSATAPEPPASGGLTAPTNLSVQGLWQTGPSDMLTWTPVPGAASYNVYLYGVQIASGLKTASFHVPLSAFCAELTYTVSAVDATGTETLPSAPAEAQGMPDPSQQPGWIPTSPVVPSLLTALPEWNAGVPRLHLQWKGDRMDFTYTVYRDGTEVASGLWGLNYIDAQVHPGETHTYTVSGSNVTWTQSTESAQSAPVTVTALSAAPAPQAAPVEITGVQANDDSALISFAAVPGAVDYRVYDAAIPNSVKYSGGSLSIELNGIDPAVGAHFVVEAVDKLGPFQTMDGAVGPGAMQMDGMHMAINGQGDPSNVPNVLAKSALTAVTVSPRSLTGDQVFFDSFRSEQPLTPLPLPPVVPNDGTCGYGLAGSYQAVANNKWEVRNYGGDMLDTSVFFMDNHFMDTLYDGGTPGVTPVLHNNNTSLVFLPKATADISGGRVLHVTFEVDPHMDGRRWCDLFVGEAGDTLTDPGKFVDFPNRRPTVSGKLFRWEIQANAHAMEVFPGIAADAASDAVYLTQETSGAGPDNFGICARSGMFATVDWNGTSGDLDKRHKFDLYLSASRAVIMEQGRVVKDATFPPGVTLPFTQCQVYFVHQVYHTNNDRPELEANGTDDSYWYNYRPFGDERHWDGCGQEVLSSFPTLPTQ